MVLCVEAGVELNCKTEGKVNQNEVCNSIGLQMVTPPRRLLKPQSNYLEPPCSRKVVEVLEVGEEGCVKRKNVLRGKKLNVYFTVTKSDTRKNSKNKVHTSRKRYISQKYL